jgi:hypothetical protein
MKDSTTMDDQYGGQLAPDTMLPQQFFGPLRKNAMMDGEHRLMVAVLEDGVRCFQKQLNARDPKARQLYLDAEEWITSTDQTWFFSFVNVCQTLDLDPDYIREGLLAWRDAQPVLDHAVAGDAEADEPSEPPLRRASGA